MANAKTSRRQNFKLNPGSLEIATEAEHRSHLCERDTGETDYTQKPSKAKGTAKAPELTRDADVLIIAHLRGVSLAADPSRDPELASTAVSLPLSISAKMSSVRLFVASLGNPAPYKETRHSAGHVLLKLLQSHLKFPTFKKSKPHANGLVSVGADIGRPEYTLWQSPSYMNVSGKDLLKAYRQFVKDTTGSAPGENTELPGLIVLHDEMETAPAQLKARNGNMSARGHNGIKSVQQSLQSAGLMGRLTGPGSGGKFIKIGVGIGRPAGGTRDKDDVSAYVLGKFAGAELANLAGSALKLEVLLEDARAEMSD